MNAEAVSPATSVTMYALTDPESGKVRYVGRTTHNPWKRYSEHLMGTHKATKAWIRGLRPEHKVPDLKILEEQVQSEDANGRERYWIGYWRSQGAQLLNYAPKPKDAKPVVAKPPVPVETVGALGALLAQRGMTGPSDLGQRLGVTKQYGWLLWHGKIGLSGPMIKRIHDTFGIPLEELVLVEREIPPKRRGPQPKPPQQQPPEEP